MNTDHMNTTIEESDRFPAVNTAVLILKVSARLTAIWSLRF